MVKSKTVSKYNILSNLEHGTVTHYYRIYSLQSQVQERNKKCLSWKAKGMSLGQKLLAEDLNLEPSG